MLPRLVVLLASMAVLASCSSDPPGTVADAAPDQVLVDTGALDVALDTAPDAGECDPACGSLQVCDRSTRTCVWADAGTDTGSDIGTLTDTSSVNDTGADTSATDTGPSDSGRDAGDVVDASDATDTGPSCPGACVEGSFRCNDATGYLERCALAGGACPSFVVSRVCSLASSPPETCRNNTCSLCTLSDAGTCADSCTSDANCADRGYARCVEGYCSRRGYLECASNEDCGPFMRGVVAVTCSDRVVVDGRSISVCGGRTARCSTDVMCPVGFRCDLPSGFCMR